MAESISSTSALTDEINGAIVTLYVGLKRKSFTIHKNLLCEKSPVFSRMFSGSFKEAADQEAYLPNDDPAAFQLLISWLYRGNFPKLVKSNSEKGHEEDYEGIMAYLHLYSLMDKYHFVGLEDITMDAIGQGYSDIFQRPTADAVMFVFSATPVDCKLRAYMTDSCISMLVQRTKSPPQPLQTITPDELFHICTSLPDLGVAVFRAIADSTRMLRKVTDPIYSELCLYHSEPHVSDCPQDGKCYATSDPKNGD